MLLFLVGVGCEPSKTADEYIKSAQSRRAAGDISAAIIDLKNALQRDPKNLTGRVLLAQFYLDLPDPVGAEAELLRARQDGADPAVVTKPLAQAELLLGKPEASLKEADAPPEGPAGLRASLMAVKAEAFIALGRVQDAREALEAGAKLDAHSVDVLSAMVRYALATGDITGARKRLAQAQEQDPKNVTLLDLEGAIAFAGEDFPASAEAYKKMLGSAPWSLVARLGLARAQVADGKPRDANANLAVVLKAAPNAPAANYLRALAAYQEQDYATAQTHIQRTLGASKNSAPALLLAGATSYALRQYEQANAYLNQYVYLVPQNVHARKLLASVQIALGHSADAVKTLSPAIEGAEDAQLLALIGSASARIGDFAAANRYLSKALEQQPGDSNLRTDFGITQVALGQTDAGIEALEEASRQNPDAVRADSALFVTYFRQKDYDKALEVAERLQKSRPKEATGFDFAGAVYLAKSDEQAARTQFMKARELHPGDAMALRSLAALAARRSDIPAATQYYGEILKANPKDVAAYVSLAGLEEQEGRRQEAKATLHKAIEQNPDDAALPTVLGRINVVEHNYGEALSTVQPALGKNPNDPALLEVAGQAQLALGNPDGALSFFRTLAEVMPQASASHRYLAEAYLAGKSSDLALSEAQKSVEGDPKDARAKFTLARVHAAKGDYADAGKLLGELAADYPRDAGVAVLQGDVALAQNRGSDAVASFQRALAISDNATYRTRLAMAEAKAGHIEEAAKTLSEWVDAHPDDTAPRQLLGDLYVSAKRFDDAQSQYEAVLSKTPNATATENNLAWILSRKGDATSALDHARHAASLAPNDASVLDTLGVVLMQNRHVPEAVETLERAAGMAPASPEVQFHFAQALASAGNKDKARDVLRALLATSQAFDDREQAQKLLQELGS